MGRVDERAHAVALRNLAKVLSWARKYEEAGRLSQLAAEKLPDDAETRCMAGYEFERKGQLDQAKKATKWLSSCSLTTPTHTITWATFIANWRNGTLPLTVVSTEPLIATRVIPAPTTIWEFFIKKPTSWIAQPNASRRRFQSMTSIRDRGKNLEHVRLNQRRINEAISDLEKAIELEPKLSSAHNSLGVAFAQSGQLQKAAACFERAVAISPQLRRWPSKTLSTHANCQMTNAAVERCGPRLIGCCRNVIARLRHSSGCSVACSRREF